MLGASMWNVMYIFPAHLLTKDRWNTARSTQIHNPCKMFDAQNATYYVVLASLSVMVKPAASLSTHVEFLGQYILVTSRWFLKLWHHWPYFSSHLLSRNHHFDPVGDMEGEKRMHLHGQVCRFSKFEVCYQQHHRTLEASRSHSFRAPVPGSSMRYQPL